MKRIIPFRTADECVSAWVDSVISDEEFADALWYAVSGNIEDYMFHLSAADQDKRVREQAVEL